MRPAMIARRPLMAESTCLLCASSFQNRSAS
jgi:hypothetical protein